MNNSIVIPMLATVIAWTSLTGYVIFRTLGARRDTVGLPIAFVLTLTFLYCGAFVFAVPGYTPIRAGGPLQASFSSWNFTNETILRGALLSLLGVFGFTLGCAVFPIFWERNSRRIDPEAAAVTARRIRRPAMRILIGISAAGFLFTGVSIPIPMADALILVFRTVAVTTVCLGATHTLQLDKRTPLFWYLAAASIPIIYLLAWGFTSFGFITLIIFASYWLAVLVRRRPSFARVVVMGAVATYLSLCVFVAWMSFREDIRSVIWRGASASARVESIASSFSKTKLLTPTDFESLDWLTLRLNQGLFIGKAAEVHDRSPNMRLYGASILVSAAAIVPRALWPGKPTMSQSEFVSRHTGLAFSRRANFGSGPIFELFVNFGGTGILIGMIVLGTLVRALDKAAALALREGRIFGFVRAFATGLALISPLSTIFFLVNTALISWLSLTALKYAVVGRAEERNSTVNVSGQRRSIKPVAPEEEGRTAPEGHQSGFSRAVFGRPDDRSQRS